MISTAKIPQNIKELVRRLTTPRPPRHISEKFRMIDKCGFSAIEASLKHNYFSDDDTYLSSDEGQKDLQDHLGRLEGFRSTVIPWLNDAKPLMGANILEIGCGTGSSTVALAEQGAKVTGIDISERSLIVAKERCQVYGLKADFVNVNATEVDSVFPGIHFDFIIFFAALEHMTYPERMVAMKKTWNMLKKNDLWCVTATPNRLWFYDGHTSLLTFYHWLPDDLAFAYSRFSPRKSFNSLYHELTEESRQSFVREGRGVSFHEFELAMGKVENLDIVSCLPIYMRKKSITVRILWRLTDQSYYESFLAKAEPKYNRGFYQSSLDLIIRRN